MPDRAVFDAICEAVSGGQLAKLACQANGISTTTLYRWCDADDELRGLYAHARVLQCHALADECVSISDGTDVEAQQRLAEMAHAVAHIDDKHEAKQILHALQQAAIQRDRLRLDARKWLTSKIAPRIYGEKLDVTSDGKAIGLAGLLAGTFQKPEPTE